MKRNQLLLAAFLTGTIGVPKMTDAAVQLPNEGKMPSLAGASAWLNSPPLSPAGLHGKVVLVDFWTYSCINWRRSLPYVRAWAEEYERLGLVVIGVHTPEFDFEHDIDNVRREAREMSVNYPVAIDNGYTIWHAFKNEYWPALYFVDAQGTVRHHQFGEGDYDRAESIIQQLLTEAGNTNAGHTAVSVVATGAEAAADWHDLQSPENYVGYERAENFASPGGAVFDRPHAYAAPPRLGLNHWALTGDWSIGKHSAVLTKPGGRIAYRFHARDLHLVMGPVARKTSVRFRVLIDGQPPGSGHGGDVDEHGLGTITEQRMYQLIRQPQPIADRVFEIDFPDAGAEIYSFTFG
jgi:thiol-disulfide isomerase/thioredoxin